MVAWAKLAIAIGMGIFAIAGNIFFKIKSNNPVEVMAEEYVKEETGIDIVQVEEVLSSIDIAQNKESVTETTKTITQ